MAKQKNKAAQSLGRKSWAARTKGKTAAQIAAMQAASAAGRMTALTPARRLEISKKANAAKKKQAKIRAKQNKSKVLSA